MNNLIQYIVNRGHGVICAGNGRMLIYGNLPKRLDLGEPWYVPGCAMVDPDDFPTDEEREAACDMALQALREDARKGKVKNKRPEVELSESDA